MADGRRATVLVLIGVLVVLVTSLAPEAVQPTAIVYRACAAVLVVMAGIGVRMAMAPMQVCPPTRGGRSQ